jgi:hypothetical protein
MCASWNNKYRPEIIADRLENIKTVDNNTGKVSFKGFEYNDFLSVLCTIARLSEDIPESEKHRIIYSSAFSTGSKGTITAKALLREISILEQSFLKQKEEEYVLATSLSLRRDWKMPNYKINSALIYFTPKLPTIFDKNRETLKLKPHVKYIIEKFPVDYLAARVLVKGRSQFEAQEKALQALDLIRGIWNLSLNRLTVMRIFSFGSKRKPINTICLGPFHTLHEKKGNLKTDTFWYEPNFELVEPYNFDKEKEHDYVISYTKFLRNKLIKSPYPEIISEAIIRYTRALDYSDYEVAFIKLWSVLELLTDTVKESYDKTIKRTAFLFNDYDYNFQILSHLRDFRNKSVHTGNTGSDDDVRTYLYQLKNYVESILLFHLSNRMKFNNISNLSDFMDLSPNRDFIKEKYQLYKRAIRFLS